MEKIMPTPERTVVGKKERRLSVETLELEVNYEIKMMRLNLKLLGLWSRVDGWTFVKKIVDCIHITFNLAILVNGIIPLMWQLCFIEEDGLMRLHLCAVANYCNLSLVKYSLLVKNHTSIRYCINAIRRDWQEVNSDQMYRIMLSYAKSGVRGGFWCFTFLFTSAALYVTILPFLAPPVVDKHNVTVRPFPAPVYFPLLNFNESPTYEICYLFQAIAYFVMGFIHSSICVFIVGLIMHACGQCDIMIAALECLSDNEEKVNDVHAKMSAIIAKHVQTKEFIENTENVLGWICFFHISDITTAFCALAYEMLIYWQRNEGTLIVVCLVTIIPFTGNMFVFCYLGERLIEKCQEVIETTYTIDWYVFQRKNALQLLLPLAFIQKPTAITAGKVFDLSLRTFATIMRTALAYINVCRAMMI